jgi:hypothetical protein
VVGWVPVELVVVVVVVVVVVDELVSVGTKVLGLIRLGSVSTIGTKRCLRMI